MAMTMMNQRYGLKNDGIIPLFMTKNIFTLIWDIRKEYWARWMQSVLGLIHIKMESINLDTMGPAHSIFPLNKIYKKLKDENFKKVLVNFKYLQNISEKRH